MKIILKGDNGGRIRKGAPNVMMHVAQKCIVCGEERSAGIAICEQFICQSCEQEMVKTDVRDEKYPFFIRQMKQIWFKMEA